MIMDAGGKRSAFSIPSVDEIREASKIGSESVPSLFDSRPSAAPGKPKPAQSQQGKDTRHEIKAPRPDPGVPGGAEPSAGVTTTTSTPDVAAGTSKSSPYAIIINPLQV